MGRLCVTFDEWNSIPSTAISRISYVGQIRFPSLVILSQRALGSIITGWIQRQRTYL